MRVVKHFLTGIAIALGVFVVVAVISALITFPESHETPSAAILSLQNKETQERVPSTQPGAGYDDSAEKGSGASSAVSQPTPATYESLVNILCFTTDDSPLQPISGSGVIIDPRGVILTTAHIAQYFLLETHAECVIRQGSPASARYRAELLYLPPTWVEENALLISQPVPRGTGEHDYAFLYITEGFPGTQRPSTFPSVAPDPRATVITTSPDGIERVEVDVGTSAFVLGYPSEFLEGMSVLQRLFPLFVQATITQLFTFDSGTLDLISLHGGVLAQQGASGGAVVGTNGRLTALVVTATKEVLLSNRNLQAITLSHIERSLETHLAKDLRTFLDTDLMEQVVTFETTLRPRLSSILMREIE